MDTAGTENQAHCHESRFCRQNVIKRTQSNQDS